MIPYISTIIILNLQNIFIQKPTNLTLLFFLLLFEINGYLSQEKAFVFTPYWFLS